MIADTQHCFTTRILDSISFEEINQNETTTWSMLLATGYLTIAKKELSNMKYQCELKIPNQETSQLLFSMLNQSSDKLIL